MGRLWLGHEEYSVTRCNLRLLSVGELEHSHRIKYAA